MSLVRWLLNHTSTLGLMVIVVGGSTALAVIAVYLVHLFRPDLSESKFDQVSSAIKSTFLLLYGLIFALSISGISSRSSLANSTVSSEATTLSQLVQGAEGLSPEARGKIRRQLEEYDRAVVDDEWATMKNGSPSVRASVALDNLYATYQSYERKGGPDASLASSSLSKLDQISSNRRTRLDLSATGLPELLRGLLAAGALLFVILSYPAKIDSRGMQMLVTGATAAFLSFAFALTMVLDYPFSAEVSTSNEVFKNGILAQFWEKQVLAQSLDPETIGRLSPEDLVGVWNSDSAFGVTVFRQVGDELRATYRHDNGTVVGKVGDDGVFRGWWCEAPSRKPPDEAGEVEFRLLKTRQGERAQTDGRWRYGMDEPMRGGWNLTRIGGPEPGDLAAQFDDDSSFCQPP